MDIKLIKGNRNDVKEFRGLIYEGKEILKTMGAFVEGDNFVGWTCILDDASIVLVPKEFFCKKFKAKIIVGVD